MPMIQWDAITTSRVLPEGFYNLRIAEAKLEPNYRNNLQITLELRVVQPEELKDRTLFEFLELGQQGKIIDESKGTPEWRERMAIDDPNFEDPRVQQNSKELKTFKRMLEASGFNLPASSSLEEVVGGSKGLVFTAFVTKEVEQFGKRAGQDKNVIENILALGSETPRLERKNADKSKVVKPSTNGTRPIQASAIRPQVSVPQIEDDEDIEY